MDARFLILEAFEVGERRYVASVRFERYPTVEYFYGEIFCIDADDAYQCGFHTSKEAMEWVWTNKIDLERIERERKEANEKAAAAAMFNSGRDDDGSH